MFASRWRGWLTVVGLWSVVGAIDAAQMVFFYEKRSCIPDWALATIGFIDWVQWAILTGPIVWLARRYPLNPPTVSRLLLHVFAGLGCAFFILLTSTYFIQLIQSTHMPAPMSFDAIFQRLFLLRLVLYLVTYLLVVGLTHSLDLLARYRESELTASRLETELTQAQLEVLRMQLQPHFLFNTLHAISSLMHRDVELADRMIARLGELLRSTLDHAGAAEVPLQQELDFIAPYLEIERARLGPRLQVRFDVEPETLDALVPNLLLQPLVENAVRHGIAPQRGPGLIEVVSRKEGDRLQLKVRDTGAGLASGAALKEGVGLGNTRTRLRHLYGDAHLFRIAPAPGGPGVEVALELPFRESDRNSDDLSPADPDRR